VTVSSSSAGDSTTSLAPRRWRSGCRDDAYQRADMGFALVRFGTAEGKHGSVLVKVGIGRRFPDRAKA